MDYRRWTEVARADIRLGPSILGEENVDVVACVGVIDWHQPRTRVPGDSKFHRDDTTCFLRIKREEFARVELHDARSETVYRSEELVHTLKTV